MYSYCIYVDLSKLESVTLGRWNETYRVFLVVLSLKILSNDPNSCNSIYRLILKLSYFAFYGIVNCYLLRVIN